jgi:uncharacterized protein (UPF0276 family)
MFEEIPFLGAGYAYQPDRHDEIMRSRSGIDFLEIPTDIFLEDKVAWGTRLAELKASFPVVAHGIFMSLGDAAGPHREYLSKLCPYLDILRPLWFSDHVDMGNVPGDPLGRHFHGMQVPFTTAQARVFQHNLCMFQNQVGLPLLLENVAYDFLIPMPDSLPEPEFLREVFRDTPCGFLLDITNLQINALNFGFDALAWLEQAPLDRAVEIHVAGGELIQSGSWAGRWADTHSQPVPDAVWRMLEYVAPRAPIKGLILERDQRPPPMDELVAELRIARAILGPQSLGTDCVSQAVI